MLKRNQNFRRIPFISRDKKDQISKNVFAKMLKGEVSYTKIVLRFLTGAGQFAMTKAVSRIVQWKVS